jgi:hypothetical protein
MPNKIISKNRIPIDKFSVFNNHTPKTYDINFPEIADNATLQRI